MKAFLRKHLDDVLILAGEGFLVYATWRLVGEIGAFYLVGVILILMGVLIGIGNGKKKGES